MTVIQCDHCDKIIQSNEFRLIGTLQRLSDYDDTFVKDLVVEEMDFCNIDCFSTFVKKQLEKEGESGK